MELNEWKEKMTQLVKKYKCVLAIIAVGFILMLLPQTKKDTEPVISQTQENIMTVEEQLGNILSQVDGAGEVCVLLTQASGEEILYQLNEDSETDIDRYNYRRDTVTVTDAERNETGLIKQINPPIYLGAIVVCEGADNPAVRLAIVEAVSKVTGLGADRISVLKMR